MFFFIETANMSMSRPVIIYQMLQIQVQVLLEKGAKALRHSTLSDHVIAIIKLYVQIAIFSLNG